MCTYTIFIVVLESVRFRRDCLKVVAGDNQSLAGGNSREFRRRDAQRLSSLYNSSAFIDTRATIFDTAKRHRYLCLSIEVRSTIEIRPVQYIQYIFFQDYVICDTQGWRKSPMNAIKR